VKTFTASTSQKLIAIRCNRGDDLLGCVRQAIAEHGIHSGAVISGIGTIDQCVLHYVTDADNAKGIHYQKWDNVMFEVTGLQGIIANGEPHLHMVVSDTQNAWAGHVEPGCRTLFLCEILIMVFDQDSRFIRVHATEDSDAPDYAIMNLTRQEKPGGK